MKQGLCLKLAVILALNSYSSFSLSYPRSLPIDRWFVGLGAGFMGPFATKANNLIELQSLSPFYFHLWGACEFQRQH